MTDRPEDLPGGARWVWTQPEGALRPLGVLELPPPTEAELWWLGGGIWQWRDGRTGVVLRAFRATRC